MKLSKPMKKLIMSIMVILILALSGYAYIEWKTPGYEEQKNIYYSYSSKGSIDYKVYLKPNVMYEQNYLEKGRYYISKYVDHIEAVFKYEYSGSKMADLKTEYNVMAYLQGLHGNENEVLWSKPYVLIPGKTEQGNYSGKVIEKKLSIPLKSYSDLAQTLFLNSEVNSPVVLNIVFDVHTTVNTDKGTLEDTLSPGLQVPIGENVFKIDGKQELSGGKKIEYVLQKKIPVNLKRIILLLSASFIFIVIFLFVFFAKEEDPPDPFRKKIAGIFKEYGERLAGMEHTISYQLSDIINVNTIEDMVKIADEVGQPVFYYKVDNRTERKIEFYVFDNSRIYYMVIFGDIKSPENEAVPDGT